MTAKVDKLVQILKTIKPRRRITSWNDILKEKGIPYRILVDNQNNVIVKNMNEQGITPTGAYIRGIKKSPNFEENIVEVLSEKANIPKPDLYSYFGLFEGGRYDRHIFPVLIIISSLAIIGLSTFKITGNAIANSTQITDYTMFAFLIILIIAFILFIKKIIISISQNLY